MGGGVGKLGAAWLCFLFFFSCMNYFLGKSKNILLELLGVHFFFHRSFSFRNIHTHKVNKLSCLMVPPLLGSNEAAGGEGGIPNLFSRLSFPMIWVVVQILSSWGFFFFLRGALKSGRVPANVPVVQFLTESKSVVEQILWSLNRTCLPNYPWYFCSNGDFVVLISPQIVTTTVWGVILAQLGWKGQF